MSTIIVEEEWEIIIDADLDDPFFIDDIEVGDNDYIHNPDFYVKPKINTAGVVEIIGGLMYGIIQKDDLKEMKLCISETSKLEGEME